MDFIDDTINAVSNFLAGIFERLAQTIGDFFTPIATAISSLVDSVSSTISGVFTDIVTFIDGMITNIVDKITAFIETAISTLTNIVDDIINYISDLVSSAIDFLSGVFDTVVSGIQETIQSVALWLEDTFTMIKDAIGSIVEQVTLYFTGLVEQVGALISDVIASAGVVVDSVTKAIETFINEVVDVIGNTLRDLLETISDMPGAISDMATDMIESAKTNIADPISELPVKLITEIVERVTGATVSDIDAMQLNSMQALFGSSPVARTPGELRSMIQKFMPENAFLRTILVMFLSPLILMQVSMGMAQANAQILLQEHALVNPYQLLSPPDAVRAKHFDLISQGDVVTILRKQGYDTPDAEVLIKTLELVPPEGELIEWWLRDIISDQALDKLLRKKSWTQESIDGLKEAAMFIPPAQDLISMAVREVFSPEIAAKFGQFEDFPADFAKWGKKLGISEQWAKNYWAAHWKLPSPQMGFEMLHRRIIDKSELNLLLKASDIMPFWRDKIVAISYSPFTRVDIRRMNKIGVLSESEVNEAYLDIGYSEKSAARLTQFTIELNKGGEVTEEETLNKLTRAAIVGFFRDGILERAQAAELLQGIGLTQASANLFLTTVDLDEQQKERKAEVSLIVDNVISGAITKSEGEDRLNTLGLSSRELSLASIKLRRAEASRAKIPSRSDLDKMLAAGLIGDAEYVDNLGIHGYSKKWADKYLELAKGKASGNQAEQ